MNVYEKALRDKTLAAQILLPLMEFEFSVIGEDSPTLLQATVNKQQLQTIFRICKEHRWVTSSKLRKKGSNFYFRLSRKGFKEIYKIAGPFVDKVKKKWAKLLIERVGKIGGYKKSEKPTEKKILKLLNSKRNKWWSIMEICLKLRILPSTAREGIRNLEKKKLVKKKKVGKSTLWKISGGVPQTLPGLTAE
jgi:hypothetical protein